MSHYRVSESGLFLRPAFIKMITDTAHSHWVTLNCHADYKLPQGHKRLRMWSLDVVSRIFTSKSFAPLKLDQLFRFFAFPEYTKTGHLHFHMPLWVHESRHDWFAKVAAPLWKKIMPTGTADIQPIKQTADDLNWVAIYATKYTTRPFSYLNFISSNMLDLPATGGPAKQHHVTNNKKGA